MAALYIDAQAAHDILKHTMKQLRAKVHLPLVPLATNFEYNFERPPRYNLDGRTLVSDQRNCRVSTRVANGPQSRARQRIFSSVLHQTVKKSVAEKKGSGETAAAGP